MPRRRRRVIIHIPSSTPDRLVFPLQRELSKFDINPMTVQLTGGRMSQQEIDHFFEQIQKPVEDLINGFKFIRSGGFICLVIICAIILPLYFFLICYLISKKEKEVAETKACKEKIQAIAKEQNAYLSDRGLMWVVPVHAPLWIELWVLQPGQPGFLGGMPGMNMNINIQTQMMIQQNQYNQQMYAVGGYNNPV